MWIVFTQHMISTLFAPRIVWWLATQYRPAVRPYRTATRAGPEGQWHEETRNKVFQWQKPVDLLHIDHRNNITAKKRQHGRNYVTILLRQTARASDQICSNLTISLSHLCLHTGQRRDITCSLVVVQKYYPIDRTHSTRILTTPIYRSIVQPTYFIIDTCIVHVKTFYGIRFQMRESNISRGATAENVKSRKKFQQALLRVTKWSFFNMKTGH